MKTTLKTSEDNNYTQKRVKLKTTFETIKDENYTQKRVKMKTILKTSEDDNLNPVSGFLYATSQANFSDSRAHSSIA